MEHEGSEGMRGKKTKFNKNGCLSRKEKKGGKDE
jgi:hypothetical protein